MREHSEDGGEIKASVSSKRWFAVCEDMFEHEIVGAQVRSPRPADPKRDAWPPFMAWQWLIKEAARMDRRVFINGEQVSLRRGQIATSQRYLAQRFNWGRQAVREFLDRLAKHDMASLCGSTEKFNFDPPRNPAATIITIRNYGTYQHSPKINNPASNQGTTQEQPRSNPKQYRDTGIQEEERAEALLSSADDATAPKAKRSKPQIEVDALAAFNAYNELALRVGLPQAATLTPGRRTKIAARIRQHGGMDAWTKALANVEASSFLRGEKKDFAASLDFLLQASSFAKVLDGAYANREPPSGMNGAKPPISNKLAVTLDNMRKAGLPLPPEYSQ